MRVVSMIALFLLAALLPLQGANAKPSIVLSYRPMLAPKTNSFAAVEVRLTFPGDSDGVTDVDLPNEWGGFDQLYKQIGDVSATGAQVEPGAAPHKRVLRHKPGGKITLRYQVRGVDRPDRLTAQETGNEYRPIINPGYFHLLGNAVVPKPAHLDDATLAAFRISGMPKGSSFASDLEHASMGRRLTFGDLFESVAVGGDFRILKAGPTARLAVRGKFAERDDAGWNAAFRKVAEAATGYWETDAGPYLVTVLAFEPQSPGSISVGGTGRSDAFAFFATNNAASDTLDLIMAHEMSHSWMPRRVGSMVDGDAQRESYWFSEGFTDFVTYRALIRSGVWTVERFAEQMNRVLDEYDSLPVRTLPNSEAAKIYWTSYEGQRLPYLRGMLFATWLDGALRRQGNAHGLRPILLAMQARSQRMSASELASAGYAIGLLREEAGKAGLPIEASIADYIDQGQPIDFGNEFLPPCGQLDSRVQPRFDVGFDVQGTHANGDKVIGVVDGSNAWKAGLRNGMTMLGRAAGKTGDSSIPVTYVVKEDGKQIPLTWLPHGNGQEVKRTFRLTGLEDPARRQACVAYLAG